MESRPKPAPLVVIVGETASGKSALALELAKKFNGQIIAADSWTVYRGFDIGTAKPTLAQRAEIPHHLIDVANPQNGFSAAIFKRLASQAIEDISEHGGLPILVGGTGLYIDSILYDYQFLPPPVDERRKELNAMNLAELLNSATKMKLDLASIDIRNKRRVIRLIENEGRIPSKKPLRKNTLIIGLCISGHTLEDKIKQRVDSMVSAGFVEEVKALGDKYGWEIEAFRAPGYRAFKDYLQGNISIVEAKRRFISNDLQLAKKQRTWFKRNNSIQWIENQRQAVDLLTTFLNK